MSALGRWHVIEAAVLCAALAATPAAAQMEAAPNEPGVWGKWRVETDSMLVRDYKLTKKELALWQARLKSIADIFRAAPVLQQPLGFDPMLWGALLSPQDAYAWHSPVNTQALGGSVALAALPLLTGNQRDSAGRMQRVRKHAGGTILFDVLVNHLPPGLYGRPVIGEAMDGKGFFREPRPSGELAGMPVYEDKVIVVQKSRRAFWQAVTLAELMPLLVERERKSWQGYRSQLGANQEAARKSLEDWLRPEAVARRQEKLDKEVAVQSKPYHKEQVRRQMQGSYEREEKYRREALANASNPDGDKLVIRAAARLAAFEERWAGMSAEMRAQAACFVPDPRTADDTPQQYVPIGTAGCETIVRQRQVFLDPQLPRTEVQILAIRGVADCGRELIATYQAGKRLNPGGCGTNVPVFFQTDWNKVLQLMR